MLRSVAIGLILVLSASCPCPQPIPTPSPSTRKLTVKSTCKDPIWIQQQGHTGAPALVEITFGKSTTYEIPDEGLPSARYWAKTGCDKDGNNCTTGQSSPPCPAAGCAPPVDSKLEATWGCTLSPKEKCAKTPQGHHIQNTFWNSSAVDGYTLPYDVRVTEQSTGCTDVNCAMLDHTQCPADENLDQGLTQKWPDDAKIDLRVSGESNACFSPCTALGFPGYGGKGIQPPSSDQTALYCCPTPPVSSAQCNAGPVVKTKYVKAVHMMCHDTTYAHAYDDATGLRSCAPKIEVTLTFCPGVPAAN